MHPTRAAASHHAALAAAIHDAAALPRPGPADIVASYVPREPPAEFLGRFRMEPQQLLHAVTSYLATPLHDRPLAMILDAQPKSVAVNILAMNGFDITIEVPSLGRVFDFDIEAHEFCLAIEYPKGTAEGLAKSAARAALVKAGVDANRLLCGTSEHPPATDLARITALLSIREDVRPAIIICNRFGQRTVAHVRDARGTHVIVEVTGGSRHVFNLASRYGQLNFEISESDAAAHLRYVHAMREAGRPFPLPDKA